MRNYKGPVKFGPKRVWLEPQDISTHSFVILSGEEDWFTLSIGDCNRRISLEFDRGPQNLKDSLAKLSRLEGMLTELRKQLEAN